MSVAHAPANARPLTSTTDRAEINSFVWPRERPFLTAEWRHLAMINYVVDPRVLAPLVPAGAEIDFHQGKTYASIVGFLFRRTRVFGAPIPGHVNFEEVNLRFYVRRKVDDGWRRGVVFVRELAPRRAVAWVANRFYGESYVVVPMSHRIIGLPALGFHKTPESIQYAWRFAGGEYSIDMTLGESASKPAEGTLDQFIAEHYWGYTSQRDGSATEYQVAHPPWQVRPAAVRFSGDVAKLYGREFADALRCEPASAFWADGSAVRVYRGRRVAS
jgi:uncharacterized protein YqjF (DUF2071 family)